MIWRAPYLCRKTASILKSVHQNFCLPAKDNQFFMIKETQNASSLFVVSDSHKKRSNSNERPNTSCTLLLIQLQKHFQFGTREEKYP